VGARKGQSLAKTVVIAEDEAIVRLDLRETLEEEGFEVVGETGRGDEAVELVGRLHPDLVVLDIKMPGLDGLAAARQINQGPARTAVLVLTAFSQRDLVEQARDAGVLAYLVKPFQKEELLPAIEVALARFAEIRALEEENASLSDDKRGLEEQLETRRWIDRAKGRLMDDRGMSEAEAFSFIQQSAMRRRTTMRAIAREVVESGLAP
jgi:AmiR/NasT family two-component response regulator